MFEWLDAALREAQGATSDVGAQLDVLLNPAVASGVSDSVEASLGTPIPNSIRTFATIHDGICLTVTADFTFFLEIYSLSGMLDETRRMHEFWDGEGGAWGTLVAIDSYGDGSDRCAFDPEQDVGRGEKAIIDVFHEDPSRRNRIIAVNLEQLLRGAVDAVTYRNEFPFYWNPSKLRSY